MQSTWGGFDWSTGVMYRVSTKKNVVEMKRKRLSTKHEVGGLLHRDVV